MNVKRLRLIEIILPYIDARTFLRMRETCKHGRDLIDSNEHLCIIFLKKWYSDEVIPLINSPMRQLLSVLSNLVYTHVLYNIEPTGEHRILNNVNDITNKTKSECYRGYRIEGLKFIPFLLLGSRGESAYERISLNPDAENIHEYGVTYRSTSLLVDVVNKQINVPVPKNALTWTDRKCYVSRVKCEVKADDVTIADIIFYNNMPCHVIEYHTLYKYYPKSEFIIMVNILTGEKIIKQFDTDYIFKRYI